MLAEGGDRMGEIIIAKRAEDRHSFYFTVGFSLLRSLVLLLLLTGTVLLLLIIAKLAFYFFTHMYKYYINEASFAALALYALHHLECELFRRETVADSDGHFYAYEVAVEFKWNCVGLFAQQFEGMLEQGQSNVSFDHLIPCCQPIHDLYACDLHFLTCILVPHYFDDQISLFLVAMLNGNWTLDHDFLSDTCVGSC